MPQDDTTLSVIPGVVEETDKKYILHHFLPSGTMMISGIRLI